MVGSLICHTMKDMRFSLVLICAHTQIVVWRDQDWHGYFCPLVLLCTLQIFVGYLASGSSSSWVFPVSSSKMTLRDLFIWLSVERRSVCIWFRVFMNLPFEQLWLATKWVYGRFTYNGCVKGKSFYAFTLYIYWCIFILLMSSIYRGICMFP